MNNCLFLMYKFRGVTLVIKYNDGFNFKNLVYKLCAKWSELVGSSLNISYSMLGHSCCGLESEEDLEVIVGLALSFDIHCIDVFVKCCSLGEGYMICDHYNKIELLRLAMHAVNTLLRHAHKCRYMTCRGKLNIIYDMQVKL